jgi:hypothetical protein
MNAELTPEMEQHAKEGMGKALGDAIGAGITKGIPVWRGIETGTARKAFEAPRELGVHFGAHDPKVGYGFARRHEAAGREATLLEGKALVNNPFKMPDMGAWDVDEVANKMRASSQLSDAGKRRIKDVQETYTKAVNRARTKAQGGEISWQDYSRQLDDISSETFKEFQRTLRTEGFDHIEYKNTAEYGSRSSKIGRDAPSVIIFDEGDVAIGRALNPDQLDIVTTRPETHTSGVADPYYGGNAGMSLLDQIIRDPAKFGMYLNDADKKALYAFSEKVHNKINSMPTSVSSNDFVKYQDNVNKWANKLVALIARRSRIRHNKRPSGISVEYIEDIEIPDVGVKQPTMPSREKPR